jgi:hypothetical protein
VPARSASGCGRWLDAQRDRHPPKRPIAAAIRYVDNEWDHLGVFLDEARLPLDDNGSQRALQRIALGGDELSLRPRWRQRRWSEPWREVAHCRSTTRWWTI